MVFSTFLPNDKLGQDEFLSEIQKGYVYYPNQFWEKPSSYSSRYHENKSALQTIPILISSQRLQQDALQTFCRCHFFPLMTATDSKT